MLSLAIVAWLSWLALIEQLYQSYVFQWSRSSLFTNFPNLLSLTARIHPYAIHSPKACFKSRLTDTSQAAF